MKSRIRHFAAAVLAGLTLLSCAATHLTSFVHPEYNFGQVERVAVVPFENLTTDQGTGSYVTRVFLTELLATGAFDIVEPGEVTKTVGMLSAGRGAEMSMDQLKKAGKDLGVQAIIFGTVGESADLRSSSGVNSHVVSVDLRMVDTETGTTIWSAVVNTGGPGFFTRFLGAGEQSRSAAVEKAVHKAVHSLVK